MFTLRPQGVQRQKELDIAVKALRSGRDITILGPQKIGKSSFLLTLQHELKQTKNTIPIIFSAERCTTLTDYVELNLQKILDAYSSFFAAGQTEKILSDPLIDIEKGISETKLDTETKESLRLLILYKHDPRSDIDEVINTLFSLPQLLASQFRQRSFILIDDANPLRKLKSEKTLLSLLTDFIESRSGGTFAIASAFDPHIKGITTVRLRPLTLDATQTFLKEHGISLDEESLTILYNFSEGHPLYINLIGRYLKLHQNITPASLRNILSDLLDNELDLYFSERLNSLSPKELPILFCMAQHDLNSPSRISRILNYSQTNVRRFLSIMEEKGFVSNPERGTFMIHDNVFKTWLKRQK